MEKVLKLIKSVCPDCKTKGQVIKEGQLNFCDRCKGKGYQTIEELQKEI